LTHFIGSDAMFHFTKSFLLGILFATVCVPVSASAHEVVAGRVEARRGNAVHLCLRAEESTTIGEQFAVSHHAIRGQSKEPAVIRSQRVGTIRIDAVGTDHCADATLLSGSAEALDWAVRDAGS
jgi:hypothetical protein